MIRSLLYRLLLGLDRCGLRFERVLHDEYRVPLVCRMGFHEPGLVLNGSAPCARCGQFFPVRFVG